MMEDTHAMENYRKTARAREKARHTRLIKRQKQAWVVARRAAALLKTEFGAKQVVVFGSLLSSRLFHTRSDIDLAVWGLNEKDYYRAVSCLLNLDPQISIDLVEFEYARPTLQINIQENGVVL